MRVGCLRLSLYRAVRIQLNSHNVPDMNDTPTLVARLAVMAWCGTGLIGLVVSMAGMHIDRSAGIEAGQANSRELWPLWICSAGLWVGLTALWWMIHREAASSTIGAKLRWVGRDALLILFIAVAARAAVLITHQPALSDDIYRYVFDGRNFAAGLNPYLVIPRDRHGAADENWRGELQVVEKLAYRELPTPYLPVTH